MQVSLIGKNSIQKIILPKNPIGNYWISDKSSEKEKKLIDIQAKDGKWQIESNNYVKIINPKCINIYANGVKISETGLEVINKIILKEYTMHAVILGNSNEIFILYCSETCEENYLNLNLKNTTEILIGNGVQNDISYNNILVSKNHARIFKNNNMWMIQNMDKRYGTFVNNASVSDEGTVLFNGDVVFIMGLKLFVMGNSIFINNPQNNVSFNENSLKVNKFINNIPKIKKNEETEEETDLELYSDKDYFSRAPRITNMIEREHVKIDAPPNIQDKEQMPAILTIGSTLSMGIVMIISMAMTIDGRVNGTATAKDTFFSLFMSFAMLISMLLFPILTVRYEKHRKIKYEEKRQKRYRDYLNKRSKYINNIMNKQRNILFENYVPAEECAKIILDKGARLWERKIEDHDFLHVRWGIGDVPLNIDIQYPEEKFTMEDDNLVDMVNEIANNSKIIKDAPVVTSLAEKNISALILNENDKIQQLIQNLIVQLIAFQSYEDLKLVFLLKKDNIKQWEFVKMLPHVWNNTKQIRFFADNYDDMREISKYLEEDLKSRREYENERKDYKSFMPYYLIITDDYKKIQNLQIIREILKSKNNLGFSLLFITSDMMQLPNECKMFISFKNNMGRVFENEISSTNQKEFKFDISSRFFFQKICPIISNIPIRYSNSGKMLLPNSYTFLEMYDVGCVEQLNILERWKRNDSTLSLRAQVGIDSSGMPVVLDIHEKFHGPHGLIAGSTGSGKSEFIITYILSLAINYHPDDVTFILIDYKGGGLAGAFQKNEVKLPHLVGTITNLDKVGLQRSLDSIQSELRRRQIIFNEAKNMIDEGTMDIYKYQRLYHEGVVNKAVPHLLIICDEFAELKQQQEEFMDELISVSRIGRSLGVHLILATQKPAGIVNDQIRSNSKFAVCLKVQDREDSNDVIKKPDAANLKKAGQFYLQVGNDEYFVLGQSAWSGAPYIPSNIVTKNVDNSVEIISDIGFPIKQLDDSNKKVVANRGEQLTHIVRYMYELANQEGIKEENLWLENIPETIFVEQVRKKYNIGVDLNSISTVIGEFDDPFNQRQGIVNINLSKNGNTIIYGNAESGKETLLSTMIYDLMTTYTPQRVQIYVLDFGSEALKIYKGSPSVGDVVFASEEEKIGRFFDMIEKEIKDRKMILSDYNGDYNLYISSSGRQMPMIVVILNNYEAFFENYENEYDDIFLILTREATKCGIVFIVTASAYTDLRYRLTQNFKQKIAMQINNEDDYLNIFEKVGKKRPPHIFGRGLIEIDENIYEFQTAKICEAENYNLYIKEQIENLKQENKEFAKPIPVIPNKIAVQDVQEYVKDISNVPIGVLKKDLKLEIYDFQKNYITLIVSKNIVDASQYTFYILELVKKLNNVNLKIFDAEKVLASKREKLKNEFQNLKSELKAQKENEFMLCVIIGIDKFLNDIIQDESEFIQILENVEEKANCSFIIVENVNKVKNHEYDEWYKGYISGESGIWVGNGFDDQYLINISSERKDIINNCGSTYGYIVKQGFATMMKLIGMKEVDGENE